MPQFIITVQKNVAPDAAHRASRASEFKDVEAIEVSASDITAALTTFQIETATGTPTPPRIVAIEELLHVDPNSLSDRTLLNALQNAPTPVELDEYDGQVIVEADGFDTLVHDVATALSESGVVPGLTVSLLHGDYGVFDYSMVEIYDQAARNYRAVGRDPQALIGDRRLTGRDGIVSVARTLVEIVTTEHLI